MKDDPLLSQLSYLKLSYFREYHQALAKEAAEKNWTPLDFLSWLVEGKRSGSKTGRLNAAPIKFRSACEVFDVGSKTRKRRFLPKTKGSRFRCAMHSHSRGTECVRNASYLELDRGGGLDGELAVCKCREPTVHHGDAVPQLRNYGNIRSRERAIA